MADFDPHAKEQFIGLIAQGVTTIADAARAVGIAPGTAYTHLKSDPALSRAFEAALEERTQKLEVEAFKRALDKSDTLMMFMLKAARPDRYAERSKVESTVDATVATLDDAKAAARIAALVEIGKRRKTIADELGDLV